MKKIIFVSLYFVLFSISQIVLADNFEITQFTNKVNNIKKDIQKYGAENVLVVFDIDNNLVTNKDDFASDQWLVYQADLITDYKAGKISEDQFKWLAVAEDYQPLYDEWAKVLPFQESVLTEKKIVSYVEEIQKLGVDVFALSARGPVLMDYSTKSLSELGFDFNKKPFDIDFLIKDPMEGLPRGMHLKDGICLTSGGHKGIALDLILKKTGKKYKTIHFSDDHLKNLKKVAEIFDNKVILKTYRYGGVDYIVNRFHRSQKRKLLATRQYRDALKRLCPKKLRAQ